MIQSGIEEIVRSQDGAYEMTVTPAGKRVRQRPVTNFELGDIVLRFPLANVLLFGMGVDGLKDDELMSTLLKDFPGALCALVAASADRPGDPVIEAGLLHVDDAEFLALLKGAWRVSFPLGLKGRLVLLRQMAAELGIKIPGITADAAPAAPAVAPANRKERRAGAAKGRNTRS